MWSWYFLASREFLTFPGSKIKLPEKLEEKEYILTISASSAMAYQMVDHNT
jgi:hypothetical protein